jgi:hypothetical protein
MGKVNAHHPRLNGILLPLLNLIITPATARKNHTNAQPQTIRPIRRLAEAHTSPFTGDTKLAYT